MINRPLWTIIAILVGAYLTECEGAMESIGEYNSSKFIWAYGITGIQLRTIGGSSPEIWSHDYFASSGTIRFTLPANAKCFAVCDVTLYNCSCRQFGNSTLQAYLTVLYPLQYDSKITVSHPSGNGTSVWIKIENCTDEESYDGKSINISGPLAGFAKFGDTETYSCDSSLSEYAFLVREAIILGPNIVRICQYYAEWNETNRIDCIYPPLTKLSIINGSADSIKVNDVIVFSCSDQRTGNPQTTSHHFFFSNTAGTLEQFSGTLQVNKSMNQANISCQGINIYTDNVTNTSGFSDVLPLDVKYAPNVEGDYTTPVYASVGETARLLFEFSSNPVVDYSDLFLHLNGQWQNISNGVLTEKNFYHQYLYIVSKVDDSAYGNYTLIISSTLFEKNTSITIVLAGTNSDTKIYIIVGASVLVILVICLTILLAWKCKGRLKLDESQVRDNVIYGISPSDQDFSPNGRSNSEKQENVNPLYSTTSDEVDRTICVLKKQNDVPEATYSAVKKVKSRNNLKNTEVTYAAISSSKKDPEQNAVYSAVKKKS